MHYSILTLFILSCTGALIWGIVNVLKRYFLLDTLDVDIATVFFSLGVACSCGIIQVLYYGVPHVQPTFWLPFFVSALLNIGIQYWNIMALKREDVSVVVPLAATMPMMLIFVSWLFFHEVPTYWGRIGIGCVALGSYILNIKGTPIVLPKILQRILPAVTQKPVQIYAGPWLRLASSSGARLALLCAYCGAVSINFDKMAVVASNPALFSALVFLTVAITVFMVSNLAGRWRNLNSTGSWKLFLLGVFHGPGQVMLTTAFLYGIVPYVGTLKRTQILWTVILASIFLKEKYARLRIIGAIIIFIGVMLIAF